MATFTAPARKRGLLLAGWLLVMLLTNLWTIYRYIVIINDLVRHSDPRWNTVGVPFVTLAALSAVNLISVALLWMWRIIGLYLFMLVAIIAFVINLFLGIPLITALVGLGGVVVLYALVNPRREMFR